MDQWTRHPEGPHCENTKFWPFCCSSAGLGLQLYDAVFNKDTHGIYDAWFDHTRNDYFGLNSKEQLEWVTLYYDPLVQHNQTLGLAAALDIWLVMMPQQPAFAEIYYHAAVSKLGWNDPSAPVPVTSDPRHIALGLALAKEYDDQVCFDRLSDHAEQNFEPRRFGPTNDEFGWWFNFDEKWPRGQLSAMMIMSEVGGPGAWSRLFRQPNLDKFSLPTITGVDFPALGISQAWNDENGVLHVTTYAGDRDKAGAPTRFRATGIPDSELVAVRCDGEEFQNWKTVDATTIEIDTDIGDHVFQVVVGAASEERTYWERFDDVKTARHQPDLRRCASRRKIHRLHPGHRYVHGSRLPLLYRLAGEPGRPDRLPPSQTSVSDQASRLDALLESVSLRVTLFSAIRPFTLRGLSGGVPNRLERESDRIPHSLLRVTSGHQLRVLLSRFPARPSHISRRRAGVMG